MAHTLEATVAWIAAFVASNHNKEQTAVLMSHHMRKFVFIHYLDVV